MRHRAGHEVARMRCRGERRQRQRRQARHDRAARPSSCAFAQFLGARIGRRDAPQLERRRPQAEAEDDARGLGRRMRADMRADRGAGRRADRRHPARILLRGVLRLLVHRVGIAGGDQPERVDSCRPAPPRLRRRQRRDASPRGWQVRCRCRCPSRHGRNRSRSVPSGDELDAPQRTVGAGAVILGDAGNAGADEHAACAAAAFCCARCCQIGCFSSLSRISVRADRDAVGIARHGPATWASARCAAGIRSGRAASAVATSSISTSSAVIVCSVP